MSVPAPSRLPALFLSCLSLGILGLSNPPSASATPQRPVSDPPAVAHHAELDPPTVTGGDDQPGVTVISHGRRSRVRILGSIVVPPGEKAGDVVAVLGSATVHGDVEGSVVAVGGDVELKDGASVTGDVVAIGGQLIIAPTARLSGSSERVSVGFPAIHVNSPGEPDVTVQFLPDRRWLAGVALAGTVVRLSAVLLLSLVALVLFAPTLERVAAQAAAAPGESLIVGLGVQLLALPVVLALTVALCLTIIGIPLVPLMFLLVGGLFVLGFAGAAVALGRGFLRLIGVQHPTLLFAFVAGILPMLLLTLVSRYAWWSGSEWSGWVFALALTGLLFEGLLWTLGTGAGVLLWLRRYRGTEVVPPAIQPPGPPVPVEV
jgi:hypothetical protein